MVTTTENKITSLDRASFRQEILHIIIVVRSLDWKWLVISFRFFHSVIFAAIWSNRLNAAKMKMALHCLQYFFWHDWNMFYTMLKYLTYYQWISSSFDAKHYWQTSSEASLFLPEPWKMFENSLGSYEPSLETTYLEPLRIYAIRNIHPMVHTLGPSFL